MRVTTHDNTNVESNHRELVFENIGTDNENLSLVIFDSPPEGVKAFAEKNYYKIPLYQVQSREKSSTEADVELVHICPKRYAQASTKITDNEHWLRDGYFYIYVDGYLWRELKASYNAKEFFTTFSDVNLRVQKGEQLWKKNKGYREATGKSLKSILVPYKLQGTSCKVEVAYSEVQWSWRQVQAFGGMAPTDPRLNGHEPVKIDEADKVESAQRRAKRMTELDKLGQYQQGYSNQQHPKHLVLPFINASAVYNPIVDDEIGRAREAAKEITSARKMLDLLQVSSAFESRMPLGKTMPKVTKEQAGKHAIAQVVQSQFFAFPQQVQNKIKTLGEDNVNEAEVELASDYKEWAEDSLNTDDLRQYLKTEDAFQIAEFINEIKTKSFEIITQESDVGSFYQAVCDYAYFKDSRRFEMYEVISDVVAPLKDTTADLIKSYIISEADQTQLAEIDRQDMGQEVVLKVIGSHLDDIDSNNNMLELVKLLFPKQTGDSLKDYESYADPSIAFDLRFDVDDFIHFNEDQGHLNDPKLQLVRRGLQVVWGFLNIVLEVPTTMFVMNKYNQPFKTAYASHIKQEESLKKNSEKLNKDIKGLEQEIAAKKAEIKAIESHKQSMHAEITAQGLDPKKADAQITVHLEQRQQELEGLQQEARQAKNANIRTKRHIANLKSAGQDLLTLDGSVKIRNVAVRQNPYQKFMHLSDMVTDGLINEIDIDANQYLSGNLPDNKIPLNFLNRVERAKQKLSDFNRASSGLVDAMETGNNVPKAKLKINNKHSIQARLDHLVNLDGSLDELENMFNDQILKAEQSKQVLHRKLLVIDGTALSSNVQQLKANKDFLKKANIDKTKVDWDLIAYEEHTKTLSTYKKWHLNPALFNKAFNVMLPFVATMEVVNFYRVVENEGSSRINKVSAAFDLADLMVSIGRNIAERRVGLPTNTQVQIFLDSPSKPVNTAQTRLLGRNVATLALKVTLIVASDTLSFVASGISMYCALVDMNKALGVGNTGLAVGHAIMSVGFAAMTVGSGLALMGHASLIAVIATGPFFLIGLIALLIGAVVIYWFTESAIESWLQACPWGKEKYTDDDANNSSIRASQWLSRPDYCLIDLYNVLYSPYVNVDSNLMTKQVNITVNVPKAARENGLKFTLSWRKLSKVLGSPESQYQDISLKQLEHTNGSWQLLLNRSGWKYGVSYSQLIKVLGLKAQDNIELKASVVAYPEGKGMKVLANFDSEFALPVSYYKAGKKPEGFWADDNRPTTHKPSVAISSRRVVLNNQPLYPLDYGY